MEMEQIQPKRNDDVIELIQQSTFRRFVTDLEKLTAGLNLTVDEAIDELKKYYNRKNNERTVERDRTDERIAQVE